MRFSRSLPPWANCQRPMSASAMPLAPSARKRSLALRVSSRRSIAIGSRSISEMPARCLALAAGSREKSVERMVRRARRPAIPTIGEERAGGRLPRRRRSKAQASARIPKTMYAAEIWEVRSAKRTRRGKRLLRSVTPLVSRFPFPVFRPTSSGFGPRKRLVDQHDRNVGDDWIDEVGLPGVQALSHDRLLVAELLSVLIDELPARFFLQLDQLERALCLGADENRQQLGVDGHVASGREVYSSQLSAVSYQFPMAFP